MQSSGIAHQFKKHRFILSIILIIIIQVIMMFVFGSLKYSFHVDELATYGLSSNQHPFLYPTVNGELNDKNDIIFNTWVPGSFFINYIEIQESERFNYANVYSNMVNDSHPPLYFYLFNTIYSFSNGSFSKWIGIIINIVFFVFCQIVLLIMSVKITKSKSYALISCFTWGFSVGAINSVVFIRMYMMLTLFVLLSLYLTVKIILEIKSSIGTYSLLLIGSVLGCLTHYYYLIFFGLLIFFTLVVFMIQKSNGKILRYMTTLVASIVAFMVIFPSFITQITSGIRGKQAVSNLGNSAYISKFSNLFSTVTQEVAGIFFINSAEMNIIVNFILCLISLGLIVLLLQILTKNRQDKSGSLILKILERVKKALTWSMVTKERFIILILTLISMCFVIIISMISPNMGKYSDRYIFCVFPIFSMLFVLSLSSAINRIKSNKLNKPKTLILVVCLILIFSHIGNGYKYLFPTSSELIDLNAMLNNKICIYITPEDYSIHSNILEFQKCRQVFPTRLNDLYENIEVFNNIEPDEEVILLIDAREIGRQQVINFFQHQTQFISVEQVLTTTNFETYYVYKLT